MESARLDPVLANLLVGVIDLIGGRAVHAIAGHRACYGAVNFCDGDPLALAKHYMVLGLSRIYVADLDAISGNPLQDRLLARLLELDFDGVLVDVGWRGDETNWQREQISRLASEYPKTAWIAGTESAVRTDSLCQLAACVSAKRTMISMDYRNQRLISSRAREEAWLTAAIDAKVAGAVVLDLAAVGTGDGPATLESCRRIRAQAPSLQLHSGGGVRHSRDVEALVTVGCERVLVATALYPGPGSTSWLNTF
jgi:phosphoribosylformimino-5-aminoimidazole carboxamide ribotide isomerase